MKKETSPESNSTHSSSDKPAWLSDKEDNRSEAEIRASLRQIAEDIKDMPDSGVDYTKRFIEGLNRAVMKDTPTS